MGDHETSNDEVRAGSTTTSGLGARSASPAKRTAADMEASGNDTNRAIPGSFDGAEENTQTDFDRAMSGMTPTNGVQEPPPGQPVNGSSTPSIDDQVRRVYELAQKPLDEGTRGYVVSVKWLQRVIARSKVNPQNIQFPKEALEGEIGPVDNSDIVPDNAWAEPILHDLQNRPFIPLKPGLLLEDDIQILPEDAWGLIISWYGLANGQKQIERFAHNTSDQPGQNIIYELYPPVITIRKVPQPDAERPTSSTSTHSFEKYRIKQERNRRGQRTADDAVRFVASRQEGFQAFLRRSKEAAGIPLTTKVRIFRVLNSDNVIVDHAGNDDQSMPSPPESRGGSPAESDQGASLPLVCTPSDFQKLELGKEIERLDVTDLTNNANYTGSSNLGLLGITGYQTFLLEEQIGGPAGGEFESDKKKPVIKTLAISKAASTTSSGRTSPVPGGMVTRGRTRRDGRTRGTVGLANLGNTCYMNSALQCIRSVEELAIYFLSDKYKREINSENPLGYHGSMARQYAAVLQGIYSVAAAGAFTPNQFKKTLGGAQPLFSGYGQQDSQEFLSFLVDALHEDLNRIQKKPYNENPDSDDKTVGDPEAIIALGETYRQNHKARNDSVAMDLFSGFYKNTMECPVCDKISITFDPYSLLTVQLPIENTARHTFTFVPLGGRPVNHLLDIDKNATIKAAKQLIASKHHGVAADRLWMVEVYNHKIYKVFEDQQTLSELSIASNDYLFLFELPGVPTNAPEAPKRKVYYSYGTNRNDEEIPGMDSPKAEQFAVPVFSRQKAKSGSGWEMIKHPLYILLTREEAQNYDAILKKVLFAVASLTSRPILVELSENQTSGRPASEHDMDKVQNGEDDARVSDHSVPSDDGYVQVSLDSAAQTDESMVRVPLNFMDAMYEISSALREQLFAMKIAKSTEGPHCAGLNNLDNRAIEMSSRVRRVVRRDSNASASSADASASNGSTAGAEEDESDADDDEGEASKEGVGAANEADADASESVADSQNGDETNINVPSLTQEQAPSGLQVPKRRNHGNPNKFSSRRNKKGKKGGKKNKRQRQQDRPFNGTTSKSTVSADEDDNPYYVKLGEGIVLDWEADALDALFGGSQDDKDEMRGHYLSSDTGRDVEMFDDPEQRAKDARRAERKKNGVTLEDCFVETGKREILSEDNAWYCNRCKEMRQAAKTLEIWTIPDILIVHLKRFGGTRSFRDKIDVFVDYPTEGLDLTERIGLKEDGKEYIYDLFAVDNHYGGLGGGHYTALAKNFYDGQWYDYNDSSCSKIGEAKIHSPAAYLLFYRRRSDKPLGPQYLQDLVTDFRNPLGAESAEEGDELDAGEGKLGGQISSLHGSPSASTGVGVAVENQSRLGGGVGAGVGRHPIPSKTKTSEVGYLNGKPMYGPARPPAHDQPSWSWDSLDASEAQDSADDLGGASGNESMEVEPAMDDTEELFPGANSPRIDDADSPPVDEITLDDDGRRKLD